MKAASVKEIKDELVNLPQAELLHLCLRLAKFKKENKELISYLLFEASDETTYVNAVKEMLDALFGDVNTKSIYLAKKTIRKIIRTANKYARYSDKDTTEVELLMHVCMKTRALDINLKKSTALLNLYNGLLKKIGKAIDSMHEDLQYDYLKEFKLLHL